MAEAQVVSTSREPSSARPEAHPGPRRSLRVPFQLQQYTRPAIRGPFRLNSEHSAARPRTLFTFHMQSRQPNRPPIETHVSARIACIRQTGLQDDVLFQVFLPQSQICSLKEPIPFFVTLFGSEATLSPFLCYAPSSSASFHPLSSPSETSIDSLQRALKLRASASSCPLRIILQRTTAVDVDRAGVPCIEGGVGQDFASKNIGQGVIHNVSRGTKSITWAGTITVGADIGSGAFIASGLRVSVSAPISNGQLRDSPCSRARQSADVGARAVGQHRGVYQAAGSITKPLDATVRADSSTTDHGVVWLLRRGAHKQHRAGVSEDECAESHGGPIAPSAFLFFGSGSPSLCVGGLSHRHVYGLLEEPSALAV